MDVLDGGHPESRAREKARLTESREWSAKEREPKFILESEIRCVCMHG